MFERMYYRVYESKDEKFIRYTCFTAVNGEVPDEWDEDDYRKQRETSVDIINLVATFKVSDIVGLDEDGFRRFIDEVESRSEQRTDRLIEHEAVEHLKFFGAYEHLDMWDVTEDTPCGDYWSNGYWIR